MTSELAALLALATGKSKEVCESFVKRFFTLVAEELEKGESVRIKGFGSFKLMDVESRKSVNVATGEEYEIPAHQRVVFVASKELASQVNLPFEAFEAIELANEEILPEDIPSEDRLSEDLPSEDLQTEEATPAETGPEDVATDIEPFVESTENIPKEVEPTEGVYSDESESQPRFRFAKGFIVGFVVALAVASGLVVAAFYLGFIHHPDLDQSSTRNTTEMLTDSVTAPRVVPTLAKDSLTTEDSVAGEIVKEMEDAVPTRPSDDKVESVSERQTAPVYDTVTTTRYLTTIAKEHYGNFNLWPIIYEENQSFLGHPDRIKPGTRVVVPPLSKYHIDPSNAEQVKEIKRRGVAIYARFKK